MKTISEKLRKMFPDAGVRGELDDLVRMLTTPLASDPQARPLADMVEQLIQSYADALRLSGISEQALHDAGLKDIWRDLTNRLTAIEELSERIKGRRLDKAPVR